MLIMLEPLLWVPEICGGTFDAQYEIPKGSNKNSMFAGALWIGGVDDGGNLKVAAMTYRQGGNDFGLDHLMKQLQQLTSRLV